MNCLYNITENHFNYLYMKKIILIITIIFLSFGCSQKPKVYYFNCNGQDSEVVYTYFPQAINSLNYSAKEISKDSNFIIASKQIVVTNKSKGIEKQFVEIKFKFNFKEDTIKSEITQYYMTEINGKQKIKKLNNEQLEVYEKDVLTLQEKLLFYCNPKFKGR